MPVLKLEERFVLESGKSLLNPKIQYHSYGQLNTDSSNVIWVCHALTGNSDVFDWWAGLFGEGAYFNPKDHYVICANILGSHYGTTGPLDIDHETKVPYFHDFPQITIRDIVRLHMRLAGHLKIGDIDLLIGGSMGGHQALEWSIMEPLRIKKLCLVATSAIISPWAAAFNHTQRMAIENDLSWKTGTDTSGQEGLSTARAIALLSYRNQITYDDTQKETLEDRIYSSKAASYQNYQGQKLQKRFNAYSYWHLAKAMDSHNVGRNRGSIEQALGKIKALTLILSIEGDMLFPSSEQGFLHRHITDSVHHYIDSSYGHDGFLIEVDQIQEKLKEVFDEAIVKA